MNNNFEIIPAILPEDFEEVADKVSLLKGLTKTVQVDICDGHFVNNKTWPYNSPNDAMFELILNQKEGLPFWQDINYEFDLMIDLKSTNEVQKWIDAGAERLVLHAEAKGDLAAAVDLVRSSDIEVGLALNVSTPISSIELFKEKIQFVQLMGIDHIGFQGQEFNPQVIEKIKEIRATYPNLQISVDGGVNLDNAKDLIYAGANRLVVGSAIFNTENAEEAIKEFITTVCLNR